MKTCTKIILKKNNAKCNQHRWRKNEHLYQNGAKMVPKSIQNGTRTAQKTRKKKDRNIKPNNSQSLAPFLPKKAPSWVQVGSQNGAKIKKKRVKKSMHFLMHAWSHLGTDFDGFWNRKWSQVGTKVARKLKMVEKAAKSKKYCKNQYQNKNFGCQGDLFSKKIGWKINKKMKCKWEGVLMSIFN